LWGIPSKVVPWKARKRDGKMKGGKDVRWVEAVHDCITVLLSNTKVQYKC